MRDHLAMAIGRQVADEVWETVDRHLFADASGALTAHTRWPLLNTRHPAYPRADRTPSLDVAGPAENN